MFLLFLLLILIFIYAYNQNEKDNKLRKERIRINRERINKLKAFVDSQGKITPEAFLKSRKNHEINDFKGCYIIHNLSKDIYYVGQSIHVVSRLNNHFTGKGNNDVYFDYRNGQNFSISVVPLAISKDNTLNSEERHLISAYNAYDNGYNKTRGNKG